MLSLLEELLEGVGTAGAADVCWEDAEEFSDDAVEHRHGYLTKSWVRGALGAL